MRFNFFLLFLCLILFGCSKSPSVSEKTPKVLVSIGPYKKLIEELLDGKAKVLTVVPCQKDPHSFEPTVQHMQEWKNALCWFTIGEPFEQKLSSALLEKNPHLKIYDLRDQIPLLKQGTAHCCKDAYDRHIWMSPKMAKLQMELVKERLKALFPEDAALLDANFDRLALKLDALDDKFSKITPLKKIFLVPHEAFGYFCREYHFEQIPIHSDTKVRSLQNTLKNLEDHSPLFALALPEQNNKGVQLVAKQKQIPTYWLDPYSFDYFQMMASLMELLEKETK